MKIIKKCLRAIAIAVMLFMYKSEDIIKKIFGYKRLDEIKIPAWQSRPRQKNIEKWKMFYKKYNKLPAIVVKKGFLIDGFSLYIAAAEMNLEYIKVTKVK